MNNFRKSRAESTIEIRGYSPNPLFIIFTGILSLTLLIGCGGGGGSSGGSNGGNNDGGAPTAVKRIFVTRQTFSRNLGGLDGADQKCQTAADAAALGGTWRAWLSTSTVNAIDRVTSDNPYFLFDETTRVFNNKTNWTTFPLSEINMAEDGNSCPTPQSQISCFAWTGTATGGTAASWTAYSGAVPCNWDGSDPSGCLVGEADSIYTGSSVNYWTASRETLVWSAHLYCFEQ